MEVNLSSLFLLPIGLGMFGFVEPCTIGAHLVFLGTQEHRSGRARASAFAIFAVFRILVMAVFGALVGLAGAQLVAMQTGLWLVFGVLYVALGLGFLRSATTPLRQRIKLAPERWKLARSPIVQGMAFGLNIPACAAPLIFALIALTATGGTIGRGALTMGLFAAGLSLPLAPMLFWPALRAHLLQFGDAFRQRRWIPGALFIGLGLWSIWFGLGVDPADWSGA